MYTCQADFYRLTLLIQRILDADVVCEAEGIALLTKSEAAKRALEVGNVEAAHRYLAQVMHLTNVLVCTDKLTFLEGDAVVEMARRLLF